MDSTTGSRTDSKPAGGKPARIAPLDEVAQALLELKGAVGRLPRDPTRRHLEGACRVVEHIIQDNQPNTASVDRLAAMRHLPEALDHCRPPSLTLNVPVGAEPDDVSLPPPLSATLKTQITDWNFDLHTHIATPGNIPLDELVYGVIMSHAEAESLTISKLRLWKFVLEIQSRYRDNPFHSFKHAVDVTLGVSVFIHMTQRAHPTLLKDPLLVFSMLISAMVHDTDHPGVMNGYLVATRHPLAVMYNERSVLENHHIATAMALLSKPELDFTISMASADRAQFKRHCINIVLATDVTTHIPFMKQFTAAVDGSSVSADMIAQAIIKAADISNPTRPMTVYKHWVKGVMEEFFAQGDAEKELGLPISMNCDRKSVDTNKCQVGFISFLVAPIYEGLAKFIPEVADVAVKNLSENKAYYSSLSA